MQWRDSLLSIVPIMSDDSLELLKGFKFDEGLKFKAYAATLFALRRDELSVNQEEQKSSPVERIPHGHHVSTFRESRDGTTAFALVCCHLCPEGRTGFEFRLRHCPRPEHAATWNKPAVKWCMDAASGAARHWRLLQAWLDG